jgi:hypothetical protein
MTEPRPINLTFQVLDAQILDAISEDMILAKADAIRERRFKEAEAVKIEAARLTRPVRVGYAEGPRGPDFIAQ